MAKAVIKGVDDSKKPSALDRFKRASWHLGSSEYYNSRVHGTTHNIAFTMNYARWFLGMYHVMLKQSDNWEDSSPDLTELADFCLYYNQI